MKTLYKDIKIPALTPKDTITDSELFGWVDSDFKNYGINDHDFKTQRTTFAVLEMDTDGTFENMFSSISYDLDSMVITPSQILHFVEKHKDMLRTGGWATFFLLKVGRDFFVARVGFDEVGRLRVNVFRFSYDYVWGAEYRYRFVVPQLALKDSVPSTSDTLTLGSDETVLQTFANFISKKPRTHEYETLEGKDVLVIIRK
jgi:hypothetical protein